MHKKAFFSPFFVGLFTQPFHTRFPTAVTGRNIDSEFSYSGTIQQQTHTKSRFIFTPYSLSWKQFLLTLVTFGHLKILFEGIVNHLVRLPYISLDTAQCAVCTITYLPQFSHNSWTNWEFSTNNRAVLWCETWFIAFY